MDIATLSDALAWADKNTDPGALARLRSRAVVKILADEVRRLQGVAVQTTEPGYKIRRENMYTPDFADAALRERERYDAWDEMQAAQEADEQAAATAALDDLRNVAIALEELRLDFDYEKEVRIDGELQTVGTALVMACFAKPDQAGVILADCKKAIVRTMLENGVAEVVL